MEPQIWLAEVFRNCIQTRNVKLGRGLHSLLIKTSFLLDTFLANRLMEMYSRCCDSIVSAHKAFDEIEYRNCHSWNILMNSYCEVGQLCTARKLFDEIPVPSLVSYNSLISAFYRNGLYREVMHVFKQMNVDRRRVLMDEYTVVGLVNACGGLAFLELLRQVHGFAIVSGLKFNIVVRNALVDAYGKCGNYEISRWIFRSIIDKDIVSWNSMLVAYCYASKMDDACRLFDQMPCRNVVSWTSLISGFVKNGEGETALSIFRRMVAEEEDVSPNEQIRRHDLSDEPIPKPPHQEHHNVELDDRRFRSKRERSRISVHLREHVKSRIQTRRGNAYRDFIRLQPLGVGIRGTQVSGFDGGRVRPDPEIRSLRDPRRPPRKEGQILGSAASHRGGSLRVEPRRDVGRGFEFELHPWELANRDEGRGGSVRPRCGKRREVRYAVECLQGGGPMG